MQLHRERFVSVLAKTRPARKPPKPLDMDEPRFTMKEVAQASGGNVNTIFSWFQRGHFQLGKSDKRAEVGRGHEISFRTALEVAIAVKLYKDCKLAPASGAHAARIFTQLGDRDRDPGELYKTDFTLLAVHPEIATAKVVHATNKTPITDFFSIRGDRRTAVILIWLNFVDRDLRVALLQDGKGSGE
jgi:hypothetical protein